MKNHQINIEDFQSWLNDAKILYASSTTEKKQLYATANGNYEVYFNGERIFKGSQPFEAVRKYNLL